MKKIFFLSLIITSIGIESAISQIKNKIDNYYLYKKVDSIQNEMNLKIYRDSIIPDSNFISGGNYNYFFSNPFVIHIYNKDTSEIEIDIYATRSSHVAKIYKDNLLIPGKYNLDFNFYKFRKKLFKPGVYLCTVKIRNKLDKSNLNEFRGEILIILINGL